MDLSVDAPKPRLCHIVKWPDFDGYGFNLHAEKSKSGQFIGKVDDGSPAQAAGLREGDKIIEVNGVNISNENHRQVVERIKSVPNETKLLVVDESAEKWYKEKKLTIKSSQPNVLYIKTPVPRPQETRADVGVNGTKVDVSVINNNNNEEKTIEKTIEQVANQDLKEEKGGDSTEKSTPISAPKTNSNGVTAEIKRESSVESDTKFETSSDRSHHSNSVTGSVPGSPSSTKSSTKSSATSKDGGDLNLNMSASEMRQILAQRKKNDPKKAQIDLRQKYEIIQQM
ncbi:Na(+)/H(+) exchange regulatory cofactor NHE-RF2-like protein [Dinothrombium tinctorium]|uniref:Na(+)/H(+) exchange regulatory cofactor NHE-RF2-like protein n=1 Tax=Dinothrombium tinctorium TaxID=1965070 RepID=A0A443RDU6_9ACAR|nr:Na(+)/H(+) exchange regulatory cofactor NHE-RF2-like protein [Dinothrombium tinctorium]